MNILVAKKISQDLKSSNYISTCLIFKYRSSPIKLLYKNSPVSIENTDLQSFV